MKEDLINNPIISIDKKNPDKKSHKGAKPFISIHPGTGKRVDVATAGEDIANRLAIAKRTGQPVESITAPPPERASEEEVKQRENLMEELSK